MDFNLYACTFDTWMQLRTFESVVIVCKSSRCLIPHPQIVDINWNICMDIKNQLLFTLSDVYEKQKQKKNKNKHLK